MAGRTFRLERARRDDVKAIAALLSDDQFGPDRECAEFERYEAAYNLVVRDSSNYLGVVRNDSDCIVATMQLTVIPGLSRGWFFPTTDRRTSSCCRGTFTGLGCRDA